MQYLQTKGTLMSEVKLNLVDAERVLHGTIHGGVVEACVAALSAEPETIVELEAALARYHKQRDVNGYFSCFHSNEFPKTCLTNPGSSTVSSESAADLLALLDAEPWD